MIDDILDSIKKLEKKNFDKKEALIILLIQELKEIKGIMRR